MSYPLSDKDSRSNRTHAFGRWLLAALIQFSLLAAGAAQAALVKIIEPYTSTDAVLTASTSDQPSFRWSSSGAISRFELQLSERASFLSYWYRSTGGAERSVTYVSTEWAAFNSAIGAPVRLADGTRYFLRINALDANGVLIAQSPVVSFVARALESGLYCNPDFDALTATNANTHRSRGVHVVSNGEIDPSIRFHVIPGAGTIQTEVYNSAGALLCTLNGGPMLRSREGIPTLGLNSTMTMSFDLRTRDYFDRIDQSGPHIPAVLLGDMASLPSITGGNAASEGIGLLLGNLSNWADSGNCVKPRLGSGDTTGNLTVLESFRNSEVCLFGKDSFNYLKLTDQSYHVEVRATPVLRGVETIRNRISYKVTTPAGAVVAQRENFIDDAAPTTRMHGGWMLFALIGGQSSLPPFDVWFENLKVDYAPSVAADGLPVGNDLLAVFASLGLQIKRNDGPWAQLTNLSPLRMANGDIDADGVADVLMDFGAPIGIWLRRNSASWRPIQGASATGLVSADIDGNGRTDFIVNFGPGRGLYAYMDNGAWRGIHDIAPRQAVAANLDGDPRSDLVIDFGPPYGIWLYLNASEWVALHGASAKDIVVGDLDANGIDDVIVDFGDQYGIWIYMNMASWLPLHGLSSTRMVVGNLDADRRKDLVIDFGPQYGIWLWKNNSSWQPVHGSSSELLGIADLDRNGVDDLIVSFGKAGLWAWRNGGSWQQLHTLSPTSLLAVDADRN